MTEKPDRAYIVVSIGVMAVICALFAAWVALASGAILCENGCEGDLATIRKAQLIVAVVGILPAVLILTFAWRGKTGWALVALAACLVTYAAWGVLLELLTHPTQHGIAGD